MVEIYSDFSSLYVWLQQWSSYYRLPCSFFKLYVLYHIFCKHHFFYYIISFQLIVCLVLKFLFSLLILFIDVIFLVFLKVVKLYLVLNPTAFNNFFIFIIQFLSCQGFCILTYAKNFTVFYFIIILNFFIKSLNWSLYCLLPYNIVILLQFQRN